MKYIIIAILALWLLNKVLKYVFRLIFLMAGKEVKKEMERQMSHTQQQQAHASHQEDTHVVNRTQKKRKDFDQGEYIDFEEVKD